MIVVPIQQVRVLHGTVGPISSSPGTFTLTGPLAPANQSITFAIPAGVYISAQWHYAATWYINPLTSANGRGVIYSTATVVVGHSAQFHLVNQPGGADSDSVAANATQITDINAAAGGTLNALFNVGSLNGAFGGNPAESCAVSSLTLTLTY